MKNERIDYISLASVISALAVVFLHVNLFWTFERTFNWMIYNFIESFFYFAVPVFFMITGVLLIDYNKRYDLKTYFLKRFNKTVVPYAFWSLIWTIVYSHLNHFKFNYIGHVFDKIDLYWFFIPLFCIYLCIPVFSAIDDEKKKNIFTYVVMLAFIFNSFFPFIISVFSLKIEYSLEIMVATNYLFYPLVGWLLHNYELKKNQRIIIYLLAVIGFSIIFFGTYFLTMRTGTINDLYKYYDNVPCILYSIGVFVFIKYELSAIMDNTNINKLITLLSGYTLGVYLIHVFVKDLFIKIFSLNTYSLIYPFVFPFVYFLVCVSIIYVARKIPLLNKVVPS